MRMQLPIADMYALAQYAIYTLHQMHAIVFFLFLLHNL